MILLEPEKYHLARPGLNSVTINNLFARSVVEGHVRGRIHVDDGVRPRVFHVVHPYGMSLLFGDVTDEFLGSFTSYMIGGKGLRTAAEYLQVFPSGIENSIDPLLGENLGVFQENDCCFTEPGGCPVVKYRRVNFSFNPEKFAGCLSALELEKYTFRVVDEQLFNGNNGSVVAGRFWNCAEEFLHRGVGFALMSNGRAAATSFSACYHENMLELGIETDPEFRRMGFAAAASAKLVEYCVQKGLEPVWACMANNRGSFNLAVKLGFEPVAYLPYYHCKSVP